MLGKWPGDMTIKTKKDGKSLTFRKTQNKLTNDSSNYTNIVPFTGLHCVPDPTQLMPLPTPDLVPRAQMQTSTVTSLHSAAVTDVGAGGGGLPGDTGQSAVLDCSGGVVGCSGEGRATDCCHGSQNVGPSEVRATSGANLGSQPPPHHQELLSHFQAT